MIGKLVISLLVIAVVLHQIDAACFIYPCDDKVSDAKCTNTSDYWVSKSNLSKAKYCECCMNGIIKPGMTRYPDPYFKPNSTLTNSTLINSIRPSNQSQPTSNFIRPFNSTKPSGSFNFTRPSNSTRPSGSFHMTGKPAFNHSSTHFKDLENHLHASRKNFNFHESSASKIKILKSNSTRMNKKPTDNSISKFFFGLY